LFLFFLFLHLVTSMNKWHLISKQGKNAQKIEKSDFEKEDYLQNYIHNNPESIPIYELEKDKKLFVAKREFPTNAGPIDALAVDKDGDIYINQNSQFNIYAVQLEYYKFEQYEIMIPKLFGVEVKKNIRANSSQRRKRTKEEFLQALVIFGRKIKFPVKL